MKYTLKRHEQDKATILAVYRTNSWSYFAFSIHEDMLGHEILEAIDRGGEVVVELKMAEQSLLITSRPGILTEGHPQL